MKAHKLIDVYKTRREIRRLLRKHKRIMASEL